MPSWNLNLCFNVYILPDAHTCGILLSKMREYEARITAVCVGKNKDAVNKKPVDSVEVDYGGVIDDKHYGVRWKVRFGKHKGGVVLSERQWSAVSSEEMERLGERLGISIPIGALGENFRISGIGSLTKITRGTRLILDANLVLVVAGENRPCQKPAEYLADITGVEGIKNKFVKEADGIRGIIGWVEGQGKIKPPALILVKEPESPLSGKPLK